MTLLQSALTQILGFYPTYMRPPYFSTNDLVLQVMNELGYHVITADIDTLDWQNDNENAIQTSVQRFRDGLNSGGTIELSHDVHQWTARTLAQSMIDEVRSRGLRGMLYYYYHYYHYHHNDFYHRFPPPSSPLWKHNDQLILNSCHCRRMLR